MEPLSEIEYRVALEQWHVDMAYAAPCDIVASRHLELARRCTDYRIAAIDIDMPQHDLPPVQAHRAGASGRPSSR